MYWRVYYALDRALDSELVNATQTIRPLVAADGTVAPHAQADATGVGWQVVGASGAELASGGRLASHSPVPLADLAGAPRTFDLGSMLPISPDSLRLRVTPVGGAYLVVAVDSTRRDEALRELLAQLVIAGIGTLLVASVVGDVLARAALRPVERYRTRAALIAAGSPELRLDVPLERHDEVTRLGHTLNDMLATLETALDHERQFVNEASHELRTPLTVLTGRIEHARRKTRTVEQHQRLLDELAVDAARLTRLTEDLLAIGTPAPAGGTEVIALVRAAVERHGAAGYAPIELDTPVGPISVPVSGLVLDRVQSNVLSNALKHGMEPIKIRVEQVGDRVLIQVSDGGPGMPPDLLVRATDRFARSEDARTRPGAGLGLSLVRQIVTAAGGELRLCFGGDHVGFRADSDLACTHDGRMTVTVVLPTEAH
ncbi:ATP-binding protein [Streptomyces mirabilis]|uniref:HAMP domain-containing sensor histidine kinase n=1 Tax=Streptomyces mirabilis TaxID=68239 RepID=UPI0037BD5CC8